MAEYDYIVVGGGHDGQSCACQLAGEGRKVLLIQGPATPGGPAGISDASSGDRRSVASLPISAPPAHVINDLELKRHGLDLLSLPPGCHLFPDGDSLTFWSDVDRMRREIAKFSQGDAGAYADFALHLSALMPLPLRLLGETPAGPRGWLRIAVQSPASAWRHRAAARRPADARDLLTLSAEDFLRRWFSSEQVLVAFGAYALRRCGGPGPSSPGSAYAMAKLMWSEEGILFPGDKLVRGGEASLGSALESACRKAGVHISKSVRVSQVSVTRGRAEGIVLVGGERIGARMGVICGTEERALWREHLKPQHASADLGGACRGGPRNASCFSVDIVCKALPKWAALDRGGAAREYPGSVTIAEDLGELRQALAAACAGGVPQRPYLHVHTPSTCDDTQSAPGTHLLSIDGGYVPQQLKDRDWDAATKHELFDAVLSRVEEYAPGFSEQVLHFEVFAPAELQSRSGRGCRQPDTSSGIAAVAIGPTADDTAFTTSVRGLFTSAPSCSSLGEATGAAGSAAARIVLRKTGGYRNDINLRLR